MKLIATLILSILVYFGLSYYNSSSLVIWIALIIMWTIIDYLTYNQPFNWKDYTVLVIVLSLVEISSWYNYFGLL